MTNSLHRTGSAQSFQDDYIVFAVVSKVRNDPDAVPKLRSFLELALEFKPVNMGEARHGGAFRPSNNMGPWAHWKRNNKPDFRKVIGGHVPTTCAAVFDNKENAQKFVRRVKAGELRHQRECFDVDQRGHGMLSVCRYCAT